VDRFDNMRVFAKVVESGSFTGAAARLGISASMVSQHVKELEERLAARLLNRTTRKVSLTETGRAYYERCTRLLADLEETEQAVSDIHAAPRGELRINATPSFGILQLAPAIADFTARFPGISVELMLSERLVDLIAEGFDVAVRVEEPPDSSLIARLLAPLPHGHLRRPELLREVTGSASGPTSISPDCLSATESAGVTDSPLEEDGFELPVPPGATRRELLACERLWYRVRRNFNRRNRRLSTFPARLSIFPVRLATPCSRGPMWVARIEPPHPAPRARPAAFRPAGDRVHRCPSCSYSD
jgi:DNA-binding transcriptional LysR family regulator